MSREFQDSQLKTHDFASEYDESRPHHRLGTLTEAGGRASAEGAPVRDELLDRVAAELLAQRVGEHERDHGFADDRGCRDRADVTALDRGETDRHRRKV